MQDAEKNETFQGGQAHHLFRQAALVAVNEATFLQRARRIRTMSGAFIFGFTALVFGSLSILFLMPIEQRELVEGHLSMRDGVVAFGVSPEIARYVEQHSDVTVYPDTSLLGAMRHQHLFARVEMVDWSGGEPQLILNISEDKIWNHKNLEKNVKILVPRRYFRILDILVGSVP
ncbi:hypothetical protein [Pseudoruegeria sp. HB172150]|uniref:hypothetical protein n=1 Tax=Pseudoruegeria sp. HB172150 TaxID=2721164 RepID=UPI001556FB2B|nr:hypothetical protein [Pseudoruegeria sp. HB172150]